MRQHGKGRSSSFATASRDRGRTTEGDLRIRNGTIAEIGRNLPVAAGAREIDAKGLLVIPGGIDPHTHLFSNTKGADDYTSASRAALAGGITTIGNFISPVPGEGLSATLEKEAALVQKQAIADVILHMRSSAIGRGSPTNAPLPTPADLEVLADGGHTFKLYLQRPGVRPKYRRLSESAPRGGRGRSPHHGSLRGLRHQHYDEGQDDG